MCPLLSTKPAPGAKRDLEFVDHVARLVQERNAFGLDRSLLTSLEFDAVLFFDECVALKERRQRAELNEMLELLVARLAAGM